MRYLITGGCGFIGSNIAEELIRRGESVRILDNLSSGKRSNLAFDGEGAIELVIGDVTKEEDCRRAVRDVDYVLHHAALVSVQGSIDSPLLANGINITGTLNMLVAARDAGVQRFVFASSSAVYGERPDSEEGDETAKSETMIPRPLSPYAIGKHAGEEYCHVFSKLYGLSTVALRYFNVFGKRQDALSPYAGVIPKFVTALRKKEPPVIYGDGLQSRDFVFVADVVRANLMACAFSDGADGQGALFNIASGRSCSIRELLDELKDITGSDVAPRHDDARPGDILHSRADVSRARDRLGFSACFSLREGLEETVRWYRESSSDGPSSL